jgi:hypothetical protein
VNNHGSDSDNKKKISFDINTVKGADVTSNSDDSSAGMPVFSIKKGKAQPKKAATDAADSGENQVVASDEPVFEIKDESQQMSTAVSAASSSSTDSAAEAQPQITVQSKIPAAPVSPESAADSLSVNIPEPEPANTESLTSDTNSSVQEAASLATPTEPVNSSETVEDDNSAADDESEEPSIEQLLADIDSINQELGSVSPALNDLSDSNTTTVKASENPAQATREAYERALDAVDSGENEPEYVTEPEFNPASQAQTPHTEKVEKVEPALETPESDQPQRKQSKVEWNGPQVQHERTREHHVRERPAVTSEHPRTVSRKQYKEKKQSGVLGKSFLAMLGIGNKDK